METVVKISSVEVILVRHGETVENRMGILQGHLPGHLSEAGKRQAEELAVRLSRTDWDVVVCSDLARSYDTACAIASCKGRKPVCTLLLREMDWGRFTGRKKEEGLRFRSDSSVESDGQLYERAGRFLHYLAVNFAGQKVVVVGHGCINGAILARQAGCGANAIQEYPLMANTETVSFVLECDAWQCPAD